MPFDPTKPAFRSPDSSAELRAQFNGLKELIDAVAAGSITGAVVDSVTTVDPGEPAIVTVSVVGGVLHFSLAWPRGLPGAPGLQGPPFANAVIDGVTTLDPGEDATVTVSFDGSLVHFSFAIPRGLQGGQGEQGIQGIQGLPGEVTSTDLAAAISTSSSNTNAVALLEPPITSDPPTWADLEVLRAKINELILAARR